MSDYYGKNVLVTGGAGFVGCNLVRRLLYEGASVTVLDNLFTGSIDNLKEFKRGEDYALSVDDIVRPETERWVKKADIVFHLAARNIIASTKDPLDDFHTNAEGTLNLLIAMRSSNCKRLVYTSSASVYGNPKYLPINEDDSINLLTPYAASKYTGEGYCMAFSESYGTPITVLRLSNVYGKWQSPNNPYCGVVARFMDKARHNEQIEVHGDGLSTRDFTYVDDVVDALLLAGVSSKAEGEVFNIATGIETSVNHLASLIGMLSRTGSNNYISEPVHVDIRDIDNIRRRVLNIEKARKKLGWTPNVSLSMGLRLTKDWLDTEYLR